MAPTSPSKASSSSPLVQEPNIGDISEWIPCAELTAYNILQEVSEQIVSNCESFGKQLEGVCGQAIRKLPQSDGDTAFACGDACASFIKAFGALSHVLLELAGDLECSVRQPLKSIMQSLTEEMERTGRARAWKQVTSRFAELQERYRRSRQRSEAARGKLEEKNKSKDWLTWSKADKGEKYANEQHAAICDLAQCEEELRESERQLRRLEQENKEMLRQFDRDKQCQAVLRGALMKGTSSLRRLVTVAEADVSMPESPASEGFAGVMPCSRRLRDDADELDADKAGAKSEEAAESPSGTAHILPQEAVRKEPEAPESSATSSSDPASKYIQGSGAPVDLTISELSDSDVEDDANIRAQTWQLKPKSAMMKAAPKRRSLIFQSSDALLSKLPVHDADRNPATGSSASATSSKDHPSALSLPSQVGRLGALRDGPNDDWVPSRGSASSTAGSPSPVTPDSSVGQPLATPSPGGRIVAPPPTPQELPKPCLPPPSFLAPPQTPQKKRPVVEDSSDSDDDTQDGKSPGKAAPKPPLDAAEMKLDVLPVVAESLSAFQKIFEQYTARISDAASGAVEMSWDGLQNRAGEQCLGGHVGKLEYFWICRPGSDLTPEQADGLVCFQFVQGFAANFARILHLSVIGRGEEDPWSGILPSAIFEVRRHIFEMLPVDSIRCVVLTGEDDSGHIYVDSDVEAAYQRCRFRWFQLTQNLRRTRSGALKLKRKLKPSTRFLVLHATRQAFDPNPPRTSTIGRLPKKLLKGEPSPEAELSAQSLEDEAVEFTNEFTSW